MSIENEDGAADKMLEDNNKEAVKFIRGNESKNGDAKITIGDMEKAFTGLTKEELMKYATDPFWVRLRWFFFIFFWALWIGMLVGAIVLIVYAPKCAQDTSHKNLFSRMVDMRSDFAEDKDLGIAASVRAEAVVYQLPAEDIYRLDDPVILAKIKHIVHTFENSTWPVVLDLIANYVTDKDELFINALDNSTQRSAFVWHEGPIEPTNWLAVKGGSAWAKVRDRNYVLSQFGKNLYDLRMDDPIVKEKFKNALRTLVSAGVNGFRLANAKHFIISKELKDESQADSDPGSIHTDYNYWTHTYTTNQNGLGELLSEYSQFVHNLTDGKGLLSIKESMESPEVYKTRGGLYNFDLPVYGQFPKILLQDIPNKAEKLFNELNNTIFTVGNKTLLQWQFDFERVKDTPSSLGLSEYYTVLMLLPGVPVATYNTFSKELNFTMHLDEIRQSPSFTHGKFAVYMNSNKTLLAYTRIKTGNPGYFVVLNPTANDVTADFTSISELPERLTIDVLSNNFQVDGLEVKDKIESAKVTMSPYSACIFTYVPKMD